MDINNGDEQSNNATRWRMAAAQPKGLIFLPCCPDLPAFIFIAVNAFPCTRMQKCDVQLDPHKASQSPLRLLVQRLGFLRHTVDNPTSCVDNFQVTVVPILCAHDLGYDDEEQEMQRTEIKHNDIFWAGDSLAVDYSDEEKESIL